MLQRFRHLFCATLGLAVSAGLQVEKAIPFLFTWLVLLQFTNPTYTVSKPVCRDPGIIALWIFSVGFHPFTGHCIKAEYPPVRLYRCNVTLCLKLFYFFIDL